MQVTTKHINGLCLIEVNHPPVNAMSVSAGVVSALHDAISGAIGNEQVASLAIKSTGRFFSAGADIQDFDLPAGELDRYRDLLNLIEQSCKPVAAIMHGMALGGGFELALACHYRVAMASTVVGLPEITLGLLPGGGGTQRPVRLAGLSFAAGMILTGEMIDAYDALVNGLVDVIAEDEEEALAAARNLMLAGTRPASTVDLSKTAASELEQVRQSFAKLIKGNQAAEAIVRCLEAAIHEPYEQALFIERNEFTTLMQSEESRGLRYAFFGEREVARIPGLPADLPELSFKKIGIVGAGTMGTGIALVMMSVDLETIVVEPDEDARTAAKDRITKTLARAVEKGRLIQDKCDQQLMLLTMADGLDAVSDCDLVIEAVFEDLEVKKQVFEALERMTKPGCILASNTSALDLNEIAHFSKTPERVIGMHYFSPANIMKLLEIVRGDKTAPEVLSAVMKFAKRTGKVGVVSGVCDGFIGNRIFEEYLRQAYFLLEEGALPHEIDAAMERWGMAMGPLKVMDLAGQDIGYSIRQRRAVEQPDRPYSPIPDMVAKMGRYGQKTGKGFYLYADGRTATRDPEIEALIEKFSVDNGIERRSIKDEEIVEHCVYAMVNEGLKIVGEGIAYRPVDVDMVYLNGYGFPRKRGGPLFYAQRMGLDNVLHRIEAFSAGRNGWSWEPAPLLVDLVKKGQGLEALL